MAAFSLKKDIAIKKSSKSSIRLRFDDLISERIHRSAMILIFLFSFYTSFSRKFNAELKSEKRF